MEDVPSGQNEIDKIDKVLGSKKGGHGRNILSKLFVNVCRNNGLTFDKFNKRMEEYLRDKRNAISPNIRERSSKRGNLRKELSKPNMSFKLFCKGFRFLGYKGFDLTVSGVRDNGLTDTETIYVDLGSPMLSDDEEPIQLPKTFKKVRKVINDLEKVELPKGEEIDLDINLKSSKDNGILYPCHISGSTVGYIDLTNQLVNNGTIPLNEKGEPKWRISQS